MQNIGIQIPIWELDSKKALVNTEDTFFICMKIRTCNRSFVVKWKFKTAIRHDKKLSDFINIYSRATFQNMDIWYTLTFFKLDRSNEWW